MQTRSTLSLSSDFRKGRLSQMKTVPSSASVLRVMGLGQCGECRCDYSHCNRPEARDFRACQQVAT